MYGNVWKLASLTYWYTSFLPPSTCPGLLTRTSSSAWRRISRASHPAPVESKTLLKRFHTISESSITKLSKHFSTNIHISDLEKAQQCNVNAMSSSAWFIRAILAVTVVVIDGRSRHLWFQKREAIKRGKVLNIWSDCVFFHCHIVMSDYHVMSQKSCCYGCYRCMMVTCYIMLHCLHKPEEKIRLNSFWQGLHLFAVATQAFSVLALHFRGNACAYIVIPKKAMHTSLLLPVMLWGTSLPQG